MLKAAKNFKKNSNSSNGNGFNKPQLVENAGLKHQS
jgi:hypothetical protein